MENLLITPIEKEQIPNLHFSDSKPIIRPVEQKRIKSLLYMGMLLGNSYRQKVKIIFESDEGTQLVETTIWATTENNVVLKGGTSIPISSIKDLRLY
jgi:hypothetical protein